MITKADVVCLANPDILIFFSGFDSDFNIEPAVGGSTFLDYSFSFHISEYPWFNKLVLEVQEYDEYISNVCFVYKGVLMAFRFDAMTQKGGNRAPLVVKEWGMDKSDAGGKYEGSYASCLRGFMVERKVGWVVWVLVGSYYVRSGG